LIRAKLSFYFTDKSRNELLGIFDGLLTRRDNLATEMFGMESKYKNDKNIRSDLSFNKKLWEIDAEINKNRDDVRRMIEIILKDIQGDVAAPETRGG
jgi:hypothetical protein